MPGSDISMDDTPVVDKGKGKAVEEPEEEVEDSGEEADDTIGGNEDELDDVEEDDLAEIDTNNILPTGRRTRGKEIDFAKAAQEQGLDEDEDEDDEEYQAPVEGTTAGQDDKMDEGH